MYWTDRIYTERNSPYEIQHEVFWVSSVAQPSRSLQDNSRVVSRIGRFRENLPLLSQPHRNTVSVMDRFWG